jgi:2-polyprenyl-6-methoxyphenol hydroxylase-like FAD-dependent oxidoreductase
LSAAVSLERCGIEVSIFEKRADIEEQAGGGIIVQKVMSVFLDKFCTNSSTRLTLSGRQFLDEQGCIKSILEAPQETGSWSSLWHALRGAFKGAYHSGVAVSGIEESSSSSVSLASDSTQIEQEFDLVIVADGGGSKLRKQLLGDDFEPPSYAGYVAWRGVVPPEDLEPETRKLLMGEKLSFFHGDKTHILFYPIPISGGTALNWVWYWNLPEYELQSLLKDSHSGRDGAFSIPPGMLGEHTGAQLHRLAKSELPENLRHVIEATRRPFLQPIVDYKAPRLLFHGGKVALLGDAGCVLRPHTAYGTAKAVEEADGLCNAILKSGEALREWESGALKRNADLARYGEFLGKSQQERDLREKVRTLQGQKLDSSSSIDAVISAHGGA